MYSPRCPLVRMSGPSLSVDVTTRATLLSPEAGDYPSTDPRHRRVDGWSTHWSRSEGLRGLDRVLRFHGRNVPGTVYSTGLHRFTNLVAPGETSRVSSFCGRESPVRQYHPILRSGVSGVTVPSYGTLGPSRLRRPQTDGRGVLASRGPGPALWRWWSRRPEDLVWDPPPLSTTKRWWVLPTDCRSHAPPPR